MIELRRDGEGLSPRGRGNRAAGSCGRPSPRSIPAWAGKPRAAYRPTKCFTVYPRVGGETRVTPVREFLTEGLSPRGRGNLAVAATAISTSRSIPAWAGKPARPCACRRRPRVYPRVGGETYGAVGGRRPETGLSPRGRGNLARAQHAAGDVGSIPAWAGKPPGAPRPSRGRRVYPRVGGETSGMVAPTSRPRGLSPRGRGNHAHRKPRFFPRRSIPAWAGKPRLPSPKTASGTVYPRVGGETLLHHQPRLAVLGLSPRGRGNLPFSRTQTGMARSIPAWAGKPADSGCT